MAQNVIYNVSEQNQFLETLQVALNGVFTDANTVVFSPNNPILQGEFRRYILQPGLRVMTVHEVILKRKLTFDHIVQEHSEAYITLSVLLSDIKMEATDETTTIPLNQYSYQNLLLSSNAINNILSPPMNQTCSMLCVNMSEQWLQNHLGLSPEEYPTKMFDIKNSHGISCSLNTKMVDLAEKIIETTVKTKLDLIELESDVLKILVLGYKRIHASRYRTSTENMNPQDVSGVFLARQLLLQDLAHPPEISELAIKVAFSESKLKRLFKQVFGTSIYHYYLSHRMNKAVDLLKEEGYTVGQVSEMLGYINPSQFTKMFKTYHNCLPHELKKRGEIYSQKQ